MHLDGIDFFHFSVVCSACKRVACILFLFGVVSVSHCVNVDGIDFVRFSIFCSLCVMFLLVLASNILR